MNTNPVRKNYVNNGLLVKEKLFNNLAKSYVNDIAIAIEKMANSINVDKDAYLNSVNRWNSPCPIVEQLTNQTIEKLKPIVTSLLNSPVRVIRSSIIRKSGISKKGTHAHQDSGYWITNNSETYDITSWIALDDVDESNGALIVLEKSHLKSATQQADFFGKKFC